MQEIKVVLSLFDGHSCFQIALKELGITPTYYASEIDKHAIKATMQNFPNTIQLGSVVDVDVKVLSLSVVYSYICKKYFKNDLQNLQSIISEREMLHRINEEQSFAAYFGTQIKNENASENTYLSINDRIWFYKCEVGDNKGIYDIVRGGERRAVSNKVDVGDLCKHSFWWNGSRQPEPGIKKESVVGANGIEKIGGNKKQTTRGSNKTILDTRGEGTKSKKSVGLISESRNEAEIFNRDGECGHGEKNTEKERNGSEEKRTTIQDNERCVHEWNENDGIIKTNEVLLCVYKEIQVTIIECEWGVIIFKGIHQLTAGGSPCQSFSFAGKRKGAAALAMFIEPTEQEYNEYLANEESAYLEFEDYIELKRAKHKAENTEIIEILTLEHYLQLKSEGYEFEGQSYLFWEYMRILTDLRKINPDIIFLLENVEMGKKWEGVLSKAIGINGLHINSALVSAQNRERIYWNNIYTEKQGLFGYEYCAIPQPQDRKIFLKDILESEVDEKYYLSEKMNAWLEKHALKRGVKVKKLDGNQKGGCLTSSAQVKQNLTTDYILENHSDMIVAMRGRGEDNEQQLEQRKDGKTNTLTSVQKDNLVFTKNYLQFDVSGKGYKSQQDRAYYEDAKMGALGTKEGNAKALLNGEYPRIRRLTEKECAKLQTIPDWFSFEGISSTQVYRQVGNGWTIEVIKHLLSFLPQFRKSKTTP